MNRDGHIISALLKTAELVCECLPNPRRLAQSPNHPVADNKDVNWCPRPPRSDDGRHTHCTCHELGDANNLDRAVAAQGHVRAHLLVSLGRCALLERSCDDGAKRNRIAQTEIHALATSGGMDVSRITDKAHPRASSIRIVGATTKVGEEVVRGTVARTEARRPDDVVDFVRVRVPSLVVGERARTVLLDQLLAVLHR